MDSQDAYAVGGCGDGGFISMLNRPDCIPIYDTTSENRYHRSWSTGSVSDDSEGYEGSLSIAEPGYDGGPSIAEIDEVLNNLVDGGFSFSESEWLNIPPVPVTPEPDNKGAVSSPLPTERTSSRFDAEKHTDDFFESASEPLHEARISPLNTSGHNSASPQHQGSSQQRCRGKERRRSGSKDKTVTLPRFLCDIINNGKFNPTVIKWLNKEDGVFLIVKPKTIAELWGECKGNPKMKYPSMSRGIRERRKYGYFDHVAQDPRYPKKLTYKFGPKVIEYLKR